MSKSLLSREIAISILSGLIGYICLGLTPKSFVVASAGTYFENLGDKQLLIAVLLSMLIFAIRFLRYLLVDVGERNCEWNASYRWNDFSRKSLTLISIVVVTTLGCAVNLPENRRNTNSRIHWVDYRMGNRQDEWVYIPTRILFRLFEIAPWVLGGILALICGLMLRAIAMNISDNKLLHCLAPLAVFTPGFSLSMMDLGEDVFVNNTFLLLAIFIVFKRFESKNFRRWLIISVILVLSTRPILTGGFISCVGILRIFDLFRTSTGMNQSDRSETSKKNVFKNLFKDSIAILSAITFHQIFFSLIGKSFFEVSLKGTGYFPIEVDSFLLTRFSGAFIGHGLWIYFPILSFVLFHFLSGLKSGETSELENSPEPSRLATNTFWNIGLLLGWLITLWTYDSVTLPYYNIRYVHTAAPYMWVLLITFAARLHVLNVRFVRSQLGIVNPSSSSRVMTVGGVMFLFCLISLGSIGTHYSSSAIADQRTSEFAFLSQFRGNEIETELTFISMSKFDLNEIERALMLSRSSLRTLDQVDCDEERMFVMKHADFSQIEFELDVGVAYLFPPSVVIFSCRPASGALQQEEKI